MTCQEIAERAYSKIRETLLGFREGVLEIWPDNGEPFLELDRSFAFAAGDRSPLTQANGRLSLPDIQAISEFYKGRVSGWEAVVTPYSSEDAITNLLAHGATVMGWEEMLYRRIEPIPKDFDVDIRELKPGESKDWAAISLHGFWGDDPPEHAIQLQRLLAKSTGRRYVAFVNGQPASAAAVSNGGPIAAFGGAATLTSFRGRGLQSALIRQRINDSVGIDEWVCMGAAPGSSSHRNAERAGFRVAYSSLSLHVPT